MYEPWPLRAHPSAWKVIVGFIVAPACAACLLAAVMPGYDGLPPFERFWQAAWLYAVIGAYPPTIVLGIPAYFALRRQVAANIRNSALVGATLPFAPWGLLVLIDGAQAFDDWRPVAMTLVALTASGAIGGVVFGSIVVGWPKSVGQSRERQNA